MAKDCIFLDYTVAVYVEHVDCTSGQFIAGSEVVCSPRNLRMIAVGPNDNAEGAVHGDPQRIVLLSTSLVHVFLDSERINPNSVSLQVFRTLACGGGCDSNYYSIPVTFLGSGMALPPGEYTISVPDQVAHGGNADDIGEEYALTLLLEPVTSEMMQVAAYNSARTK